MPPVIAITLLGRFSVRRDGEEVPSAAFGGRLVRALVRMLVIRRGQFVSRDLLTEALWPAEPPADPGLNLNVLVTRARRALGDASLILTGPGGYSFALTPDCSVDAEHFLDLAHTRPQEALDLWSGEPLAEDAYEDWATDYRRRLSQAHLDALESAAAQALTRGEPGRAVAWARIAVAEEPLREAGYLLLANGLAASRDAAGALETLARLRRILADELGLDPSPDAEALEGRLLRGEVTPVQPPPGFAGLRFAGRDAELQAILTSGDAVTLVAGPSGSGKSRLLREVAAQSGRSVIGARAAPSECDEPWELVRGIIRALIAERPDALDLLPPVIGDAVAGLLPEAPALSATAHLDEESRRALVLEGVVRLIEPQMLLVVDDLQWADASSVVALERVLARSAAATVLAYRPEEIAGPVAAFLDAVGTLGRRVERHLLGALAPESLEGVEWQLAAALTEEGEGLPMAIVESLRQLAAEDAIHTDASGWSAVDASGLGRAREVARAGKAAAVAARIDQQPSRRRTLIDLLALGGRPIPARLLAEAHGGGGQEMVLADLDELGRAGLVTAGPDGWTPAHDLIGEVAAARLGRTAAARLHARLAAALKADGADPADVGRHLAGAGDAPAAARAYADAAAQRLRRFAHREAAQVAEAGLGLRPPAETASVLHEVRAEARTVSGDLPGARDDLRSALAGAGPTRRAHLLSRMALLASGAEDLVRAAELVELALAEAGADPASRAEALWVGAIVDMNAGRGSERSDEALELFRRVGNARGIADVLDARAMATFMAGDIAEAAATFDRVARLFVDSGDLLRAGTPRSTRGHALVFLGRPGEGLADATEALELARSLGHPEGEAYARWHRAEALAGLDRGDEARAEGAAALEIAERIGHREWTAASLRGLGIGCEAAGDLEAAEAAFRRSLKMAENLSLFAAWAAARIALVRVRRGDAAGAAGFVGASLQGPEISRYEGRLARAELAVLRGDPDAGDLVTDALHRAEAGGHEVGARRLRVLAGGLPGPVPPGSRRT